MSNEFKTPENTVKKTDINKISYDRIKLIDGFNSREDYGDVEELALSIQENGVRVALSGFQKDGYFYLTDGHRRHKALTLLVSQGVDVGLIPFMVEPRGYNEEDRIIDQFTKNSGKPFTPLEAGINAKKLINKGWTVAEIAKRIGKSHTYVSNIIDVASAPKQVVDEIRNGTISASLVSDIQGKVETEQELIDTVAVAKELSQENGKQGKVTAKIVNQLLPETESQKVTKQEERTKVEKVNTLKELTDIFSTAQETVNNEVIQSVLDFIKTKDSTKLKSDLKNIFPTQLDNIF